MRILVIEDNRDILANVLDYLQLKGFNVDCAQDGLSWLHLASINRYDIIVLDIMLPGIDGYQICQRLRDSRQQAQDRLDRLTPREYEIACLAAAGHPNKRIAAQLGISEKTVHSHRLNLMDKTGAGNLADLVRLVMSAAPEALSRQAEAGQPLQLG